VQDGEEEIPFGKALGGDALPPFGVADRLARTLAGLAWPSEAGGSSGSNHHLISTGRKESGCAAFEVKVSLTFCSSGVRGG
jgi:hypothetical protein